MHDFIDLMQKGGVVMIALMILSVVLYDRCFSLLMLLQGFKRWTKDHIREDRPDLDSIRSRQDHIYGIFQQNMIKIRALIAACPLLGLLGTVIGMIKTFDTLARETGENSIHGLSNGISMALITTETGLAIAIPSVIILYYAQRQINRITRILIEEEERIIEVKAS